MVIGNWILNKLIDKIVHVSQWQILHWVWQNSVCNYLQKTVNLNAMSFFLIFKFSTGWKMMAFLDKTKMTPSEYINLFVKAQTIYCQVDILEK